MYVIVDDIIVDRVVKLFVIIVLKIENQFQREVGLLMFVFVIHAIKDQQLNKREKR